ncbi:MAG: hypothetical protein U1U88_001157 [Lawsonella clevelandensis]
MKGPGDDFPATRFGQHRSLQAGAGCGRRCRSAALARIGARVSVELLQGSRQQGTDHGPPRTGREIVEMKAPHGLARGRRRRL